MSDKLETWMSWSEQGLLVQNNRYLISVDVNLHQMAGQKNQVTEDLKKRGEMDKSTENTQKS